MIEFDTVYVHTYRRLTTVEYGSGFLNVEDYNDCIW